MSAINEVKTPGLLNFNAIAKAINETHRYNINLGWITEVDSYYKQYIYNYLQPAFQWLSGTLLTLHTDNGQAIISTNFGKCLMYYLGDQVAGEKLFFKPALKTSSSTLEVARANTWAEDTNFQSAVTKGIILSLATGTSLLKVNVSEDGEPWVESVRLDNAYFLTDFRGKVVSAKFLIRNYVNTLSDKKENDQFYLVEERYYKNEPAKIIDTGKSFIAQKANKVPYVRYSIVRSSSQSNQVQGVNLTGQTLDWKQTPEAIRRMIKRDYNAIKIGEEQRLNLPNIGVELLCNDHGDISHPIDIGFGRSLLIDIESDLITYDIACSYKIRDMYLGKGTLYVPSGLSLGSIVQDVTGNGTLDEQMGDKPVELVPGVDPENQQYIVVQFKLRADEWQQIINDSMRNISGKLGIPPKILNAALATYGGATATQIDSEDDAGLAFIYQHRHYFRGAVNRIAKTCFNVLGIQNEIDVEFGSPSIVNKDRLINRNIKLYQSGLISAEEAVRNINPDDDETSLLPKIKSAEDREDLAIDMGVNPINDKAVSISTNESPLGNDNYKGTTDTAVGKVN
jgi:hypothetical protein